MSAFDLALALLRRGVDDHIGSGAALVVRDAERVYCEAYVGATSHEDGRPITAETRFDLASLTKILCTTALALRLSARGELSPSDPVGRFIADAPSDKAGLSLGRLLAHTSGLPPHRPFFETLGPDALRGAFAENRARIVEAALAEPLEAAPGARHAYSDLGFMLLGSCIERVGGGRLDALFAREVAAPLGLQSLGFVDLAAPHGADDARAVFAATERCPWRGRVLQGEVHDDNCWSAGGILGHAGLFGSARDVAAFGAALLDVDADTSGWLPRPVLRAFIERDPDGVGGAHAYGFDVSSPPGSQAGERFGGAIGHLGFTGTSLWIDLRRRAVVALLTNRVHPSRDDPRIRQLRPAVHDAIAAALDG